MLLCLLGVVRAIVYLRLQSWLSDVRFHLEVKWMTPFFENFDPFKHGIAINISFLTGLEAEDTPCYERL